MNVCDATSRPDTSGLKQVLPIRSCNIAVIYLMLEIDSAQRHKEYWLSQRNLANLCAARF